MALQITNCKWDMKQKVKTTFSTEVFAHTMQCNSCEEIVKEWNDMLT